MVFVTNFSHLIALPQPFLHFRKRILEISSSRPVPFGQERRSLRLNCCASGNQNVHSLHPGVIFPAMYSLGMGWLGVAAAESLNE